MSRTTNKGAGPLSHVMVNRRIWRATNLSMAEKAVLAVVADVGDKRIAIYRVSLSSETIATLAGCSRATAYRTIRKLIDRNLLTRRGGRAWNLTINTDVLWALPKMWHVVSSTEPLSESHSDNENVSSTGLLNTVESPVESHPATELSSRERHKVTVNSGEPSQATSLASAPPNDLDPDSQRLNHKRIPLDTSPCQTPSQSEGSVPSVASGDPNQQQPDLRLRLLKIVEAYDIGKFDLPTAQSAWRNALPNGDAFPQHLKDTDHEIVWEALGQAIDDASDHGDPGEEEGQWR